MTRARPCRICRRWLRPDPRVGERQRTCGAPACQRSWHRRTCAAWRRRNPDYDREDRLRRRLSRKGGRHPGGAEGWRGDPLGELDWAVVREEIGLEVAVVVEETGRVLQRWAREEMALQRRGIMKESGRLRPASGKEEMGLARPPP